jgi:outer membrane protein W
MRTKSIYVTVALVFITAASSFAQDYKHQLGVRLGSIDQVVSTGFTYRYHFKENKAIEGIFNLNKPVSVGVLYEVFKPTSITPGLQWFYGAGGFAGFSGKDNLGMMGIAGLDYQFAGELPINLSIDWKPELTILSNVAFRASTVGVSIRFSIK